MRVLGLDLSTKMGWAVVSIEETGTPRIWGIGTEEVPAPPDSGPEYEPVDRAALVAKEVEKLINSFNPGSVFIEQTNAGSFRDAQRQLEFIHCTVLQVLDRMGFRGLVGYVDTSRWRSFHGLKMTKDQKAHNKSVKQGGPAVVARKGKITWKHLAVDWANEKFGLSLKMKDNDQADALAVALYGISTLNANKSWTPSADDVDNW